MSKKKREMENEYGVYSKSAPAKMFLDPFSKLNLPLSHLSFSPIKNSTKTSRA